MLKDKLQADLKAAMLSGDKQRVEALKMLKSAVTYKEVELGIREAGINDEQFIDVLSKEAKKRGDSADMYEKAGRTEQAAGERYEQELIAQYLPKQASDEEIQSVIDEVVANMGDVSMQQMGQVIGGVKASLGQLADGSRIAALVKEKLS